MRKIKEYESLDSIVKSVTSVDKIKGVYAGLLEEDVGIIRALIEFLKSNWTQKLIIIGVITLYIIMSVNGVKAEITQLMLVIGIIIYLYIKGFHLRPDLLIITEDKVYVLTGLNHDKSTGKCNYSEIEICDAEQISKYFKLRDLMPIPKLLRFHIRTNKNKYFVSRSPLLYLMHRNSYPTIKTISYGEAKSHLHSLAKRNAELKKESKQAVKS